MRDVKMWLSVAAFGLSIGLTGCVSQSEYKKVKAERDALQGEVAEARAESESLQQQIGEISEASDSKDEQITSLSTQNGELQYQLDEINRQYTEVLERANNPLPPALNAELAEFASRNSDVCEFDQKHGLVKFKSDVSFAPGSSVLTPKAREVVTRLSKILNDSGVKGYELMIAGHTDATPVQSPAVIKAGNHDNWFLSAHRAIAVGKCLQKCEVTPARMAMVGYADQRPLASNETGAGRAKNRRVELIILPSKVQQVSAEWLKAPRQHAASHAHGETAQTDSGSALNK
jgi:chemotaxis protein MotB